MADVPIKNGDFPCYVSLPEGTYGKSPLTAKSSMKLQFSIAMLSYWMVILE
jgi:polygalacturonase